MTQFTAELTFQDFNKMTYEELCQYFHDSPEFPSSVVSVEEYVQYFLNDPALCDY